MEALASLSGTATLGDCRPVNLDYHGLLVARNLLIQF